MIQRWATNFGLELIPFGLGAISWALYQNQPMVGLAFFLIGIGFIGFKSYRLTSDINEAERRMNSLETELDEAERRVEELNEEIDDAKAMAMLARRET